MQLDLDQLRELLAIVSQSAIAELTLKSGDLELTIRKSTSSQPEASAPLPPTAATAPAVSAATPPAEKKGVEVISPMVGTFYRSPAPNEAPFVEVDDVVRRGQTVCIIEAMKLMNEIEAEVAGQVVEILVENGDSVEYGQPLMRINPG